MFLFASNFPLETDFEMLDRRNAVDRQRNRSQNHDSYCRHPCELLCYTSDQSHGTSPGPGVTRVGPILPQRPVPQPHILTSQTLFPQHATLAMSSDNCATETLCINWRRHTAHPDLNDQPQLPPNMVTPLDAPRNTHYDFATRTVWPHPGGPKFAAKEADEKDPFPKQISPLV